MGTKISIADTFYDRCCAEYTLKSRNTGEFAYRNLAGRRCRMTSYRIEGIGYVTLIRLEGPFAYEKIESCVFTPDGKDAPILMVDDVKTWFKEYLSINVVKCQLSEIRYRQFERLEESYGKLGDAEVPSFWYNAHLIPGSVAKLGKREELAAMVEEYLGAFLHITELAESCDPAAKAEKTKEFTKNFLTEGGLAAEPVLKALGAEKTGELLDQIVFPVKD